jgi:hypothetical protein
MKQLVMIMVIFAYPIECNLNWLSCAVLTHTFLFFLCRYSAQPVSILHCLPADDCGHCDVHRWGLCHSSLQFAQVRFVWLFTMIYTCKVYVAVHCSLHMRFVSLLAVMYNMRFVSLFAVMCISEAYVTSLWCAQVMFVSLFAVVCTYEVCVFGNFLFQTFFCLLLPTVLVHLYGVIGIWLLECAHTHTHTQVCMFQTVNCCNG